MLAFNHASRPVGLRMAIFMPTVQYVFNRLDELRLSYGEISMAGSCWWAKQKELKCAWVCLVLKSLFSLGRMILQTHIRIWRHTQEGQDSAHVRSSCITWRKRPSNFQLGRGGEPAEQALTCCWGARVRHLPKYWHFNNHKHACKLWLVIL